MSDDIGQRTETQWRNLAPALTRQRVLIEGTTLEIVTPPQMKAYLRELADVAQMEVINGPYAYSAHEPGYGGWVHWRTSGAHIYSYPTDSPFGRMEHPLFTVDMYTCKPFDPKTVAEFTRGYFQAVEMVWKEIEI